MSCQMTCVTETTPRRRRARRAARAGRASRCTSAARRAAPRPRRARRRGRPPTAARRAGARAATPAYFSRSASSAARVPLHVTRRTRSAMNSKSASHTHETSWPSAVRSLSTAKTSCSPSSSASVRSTSLAPAGFLTSRIASSRPPTTHGLGAAERRLRRVQPGDDRVEARAEHVRQRRGAERVVDVVEAGEGERQRAPARAPMCSVKRAPRVPSRTMSDAHTAGAGRGPSPLGQW